MKIRFQADADFNQEIVDGLARRAHGIDFQTAGEAGLRGLKDNEVLTAAAAENRILVSHDRRTMPHHFAEFIQQNDSPGAFIVAQSVQVGAAIDALFLIWSASTQEEWQNLIVDLPL